MIVTLAQKIELCCEIVIIHNHNFILQLWSKVVKMGEMETKKAKRKKKKKDGTTASTGWDTNQYIINISISILVFQNLQYQYQY